MITQLEPHQIEKFPLFVDKWSKIGLCTEPANIPETKKWINEDYKVAKLDPPKYFFHFQSPEASVHAIYQVEALQGFSDEYTDTQVHSDTA